MTQPPQAPEPREPPAALLPWDSDFFAQRIARVAANRLDPRGVARLKQWALAESVDCLYFLAASDDPETTQLATAAGFFFVGVRLTLALTPAPSAAKASNPAIRLAEPADRSVLQRIARASHHDTRFYADASFDRERCNDLYGRWIDNSLGSVHVIVSETATGEPCGYVTCELQREKEHSIGRIGLIAVDGAARGQGLGHALVAAAMEWFVAQEVDAVEVVTPGSNVIAQRLYQEHGFRTAAVELWFHCWLKHPRTDRAE
jgi:dTDP-4-amino-4,6-dideoxy-D-galactose acyltransferase